MVAPHQAPDLAVLYHQPGRRVGVAAALAEPPPRAQPDCHIDGCDKRLVKLCVVTLGGALLCGVASRAEQAGGDTVTTADSPPLGSKPLA
ncbi:hypothetical protein [Streptomyces mirabilis]|uniref:hypothetical protein n=1 Tax=Streptomyces mirabilis TaxID=68239 RepID=UPI0033E8DB70